VSGGCYLGIVWRDDELEHVTVETIHVGDVIVVDDDYRRPRRVLGLATTRHGQTNRVIGWLITLEGRNKVWMRRHALVARRRARAPL